MPQTLRLTDPAYQKFLDEVPVKPPPPQPPANLFRFEIVNDLPTKGQREIDDAWAKSLEVAYRRGMGLPPIYCYECQREQIECPSCGNFACALGPRGLKYRMMPCACLVVLDDETAACLGLGA